LKSHQSGASTSTFYYLIITAATTKSTMKSFQAVIIAAIVVASVAINEPVASSTADIERELAEYERQLGTDITGTPTGTPPRPTPGVSLLSIWSSAGCY
jgi:ABC-type sulfate transport system permease component